MSFKKTIICGSPRLNGKSYKIADRLFSNAINKDPRSEFAFVTIVDMVIEGCDGCDECKSDFECVIEDDMEIIYDYIENSEELEIVVPIYMAGVPAQFKTVLDRLQPYFWKGNRKVKLKRATLHLVGEGHDPFGFEGAVLTVKSALYVAGFEVCDIEKHIDE